MFLTIIFLVFLGYLANRLYFSGTKYKSPKRLDNKVAIITGANTGIGFETALDLAKRGARIIMACKDMKDAEKSAEQIIKQTNNDQIEVEYLDLGDLDAVRSFCAHMNSKLTRLDLLINNAGVMICPYWKTAQGFEMQFGVNHLGHFLLTNLMLGLLKKTESSRVITVSSCAHAFGTMNWQDLNSEKNYSPVKAYCQSKLANILFTRELARRLQGTGVSAVCLHPGAVRTQIMRYAGVTLIKSYPMIIKIGYIFYMLVTKSKYEGAMTSIYCSVADEISKFNGYYFSDCAPKKPTKEARSNEDAKRLWDLSCQMVKL